MHYTGRIKSNTKSLIERKGILSQRVKSEKGYFCRFPFKIVRQRSLCSGTSCDRDNVLSRLTI
nr:MAG TPA: hypothetical protein [Caudoviricetes sp.]